MKIFGWVAFSIFLFMVVSTITVIHSHILIPICSLPILSSTQFCVAVHSTSPSFGDQSSKSSQVETSIIRHPFLTYLCSVEILVSVGLCSEDMSVGPSDDHLTTASNAIRGQFEGLGGLVAVAVEISPIAYNVREIIMALDDLIILVRNSEMRNRDSITAQLEAIKVAGKNSSRHLQTYTARLNTAVNM